jgi:NADPH:quinone reductase-like Zn-dependent oxidoreductase
VAVPEPGPGEVLIQVGACGVNNTDINTRTGWYSKAVTEGTGAEGGAGETPGTDGSWGSAGIRFPRIQGADVCGRVVALGRGAPEALTGRRVLIDTWLRDWDDPHNLDACGYFGSERDGGFADYTVVPPGLFADLVGYIERGEILPLVAKTYPLHQIRQAQEAFIAKRHVGNIVILVR